MTLSNRAEGSGGVLMTRKAISCALFFSLTLVWSAAASEQAPWPQFRHDAQGTSRADYIGADVSAAKWSFETGGNVYSSPVLGAGGRVYIGSTDGKLYCLDAAGQLVWSYDTKGTIKYAAPAIAADGTVYVTAYNNGSQPEAQQGLTALNADGALKWFHPVTASPLHAPLIGPAGNIYFGSNGSGIFCVKPDGTRSWQYGNYKVFSAVPAVSADGVLYAADISGRMHAVNPDGTRKWALNLGGMADRAGCSIGPDGTVYQGCADGKLYALDPAGSVRWTCDLGGPVYSSPAMGDGVVYLTAGDGRLHAVGTDGAARWAAPTMHPESSPAVDWAGKIYAGTQVFSADGVLLAEYAAEGTTASAPAVGAGGTVYVGAGRKLLALTTGEVPQPHLNKPPICAILADPVAGPAPLAVSLRAEASDPDGEVVRAEWDFGDGEVAEGFEVAHTFSAPGSYLVELTVYDDRGATAVAEAFIEVKAAAPNLPPKVRLRARKKTGWAPLVVTFTARARDPEGGKLSYAWDFGDGATAEGGKKVEHLYSEAGVYTARVTVTDAGGLSSSAEAVITVRNKRNRGKKGRPPRRGWDLRQ